MYPLSFFCLEILVAASQDLIGHVKKYIALVFFLYLHFVLFPRQRREAAIESSRNIFLALLGRVAFMMHRHSVFSG